LLEPRALILAALAAGLGAVVQGSAGFGFSLVAAPLLTLVHPELVPGAATVCSAGLNLLTVYRTRNDPADWRGVRWAGAGMVPGTLAAGVMLALMSPHAVALTVGLMVLAAVLLSLAGLHIERTPLSMLGVGVVSGFMGTASTVGGPPMALVYQKESGPLIRATLNRYFLLGTVLAVAALVPAGLLGWAELRTGLVLIPGVAAGFLVSRRLHGVIDRGWARPAVLVISAASAAAVLVKELL
jgi:uncharacterized protein